MKNGYTPKEYAHAIAIDALGIAHTNKFGELDGLTPSETRHVQEHIERLRTRLADQAKLDLGPIYPRAST